jgi:hypothetical protein
MPRFEGRFITAEETEHSFTMNTEIPPSIETPRALPSSLMSRLTNVFVSPGEVFAEMKTRPVNHANWWVPALILIVASWFAAGVMFSNPNIKQQVVDIQEKTLQKQFQPQIDSGKMTQAQVDQIKAQASKFAGLGQIIGGCVVPVVTAVATPFWGGLILWIGGMLIFKRPFEYLKGVEVTGLAMMVMAVGAVVKGLLCAAMGSMFVSAGPILLIKDYDPTSLLHNVLIMLDLFGIWALWLRAVGLAKLCDVSFAKAVAWVFGLWILITGGMTTLSWGMQHMMSKMTGHTN